MAEYYGTVICLKGHTISSLYEGGEFDKRCSECGAETITECPNCSSPVRGTNRDATVIVSFAPAKFCYECGDAYPWTQTPP